MSRGASRRAWRHRSGERATGSAFARSDLRAIGLWLVCAKVVLVPLVFDPGSLVVFATPKALISNGLLAALAGTLLLAIIRHGTAILPRSPVHFAVAAYLTAHVLAAAFALDPILGFFGAHDRSLGLLATLDGVALYVAVMVFVRTPRGATVLLASVFGAALLVFAYALVQWTGNDPIPWASGFVRVRPFSSLGNPGVLGQYLVTLAVVAAGCFWLATRRSDRRARWLAALSVVALSGAFISGTRAALLGLAGAVAVAAAVAILGHPRRTVRLAAGGALAAVLAGSVAFALFTPLGQRAIGEIVGGIDISADKPASTEGSISGRIVLYRAALSEFAERPITGVGPDNFTVRFPRYRPADSFAAFGSSGAPETSTHSWLAKLATDAGVVGLAAFAAVCVTTLLSARRSRAPDVTVVAIVGLAAFLGTGLFAINDVGTEWMLWILLAAGVGPTATVIDNQAPPRGRGGRAGVSGRLVLVIAVLAAVLAVLPVRAWLGAHAAETGRQARVRADTATAVRAGIEATTHDPLRAEYWQGLGIAHAATANTHEAIAAFERAVDLAPYHATYLGNLARAQLRAGLAGDQAASRAALETARRAVAEDPNNGEAQFTHALVLQGTGAPPAEVAATSEIANTLQPTVRDYTAFEVAARAYLAMSRYEDAVRWAQRGVGLSDPEAVPSRLYMARALVALGRHADALPYVNLVLTTEPANATARQLKLEIDAVIAGR